MRYLFGKVLQRIQSNILCNTRVDKLLYSTNNIKKMTEATSYPHRMLIRAVDGEDRLQMSLKYITGANGKERLFNFNRPRCEELGKTIERITANITKATSKKKKKKDAADKTLEEGDKIEVYVLHDGVRLGDDTINDKVWIDGAVLHIGTQQYVVEINIPTIIDLKIPTVILSGFPCYPQIEAEFIDLHQCEFTWYISRNSESASEEEWSMTFIGQNFMPSNEFIGKRLKLICIPTNGNKWGEPKDVVSSDVVSAGPGLCPFETRQGFTSSPLNSNGIRLVSYNLLANTYSDSEFSRTVLFPYCPEYALDFNYRKLLILKELSGYNADIICLQEVDRKFFGGDLRTVMESRGMSGSYTQKFGETPEGEAIFYRKDKFKHVDNRDLHIGAALTENALYEDLWQKTQQNTEVSQCMTQRGTCLKTVLLEPRTNSNCRILVATTHLYFRPAANMVRLLQTAVILRYLEALLKEYSQTGPTPSVVFCGDYNSCPASLVYEYITTQTVSPEHREWFAENGERILPDWNLPHNLPLISACGIPQYTNYTAGFQETLDYIFVEDSKCTVTQVVPMPSREELSQFLAIPSIVFPSDHVALVCDIALKN